MWTPYGWATENLVNISGNLKSPWGLMLRVPEKTSGSTSWSSPETVRFLKWKTVPDRTSPGHWLQQNILQILILISFTTHFFLHQSKRSLFKIEQDGHYRTWPVWDNIIVTELETGSNHFFNQISVLFTTPGIQGGAGWWWWQWQWIGDETHGHKVKLKTLLNWACKF